MTAVQEGILYCSPGISSSKQEKARSKSQRQYRSDTTRATIEADQILLAIQQLASSSNSANFHNNIDRISKLPKSFTTTRPIFDWNQKNSNRLKICFEEVSKFTTYSQKKKEYNNSTLSCVVMTCIRLKTSNFNATAKRKLQRLVFNPTHQ